jgi:nanoRNase/pAp phosphatase (c-di-AMP/oligoRNAs hydrolase)
MSDKHKLTQLIDVLQGCKRIIIVTHDYPDPDCSASAMVLSYLLKHRFDIRSKIVFGGQVLRAENGRVDNQQNIKKIALWRRRAMETGGESTKSRL